MHLAHFTVQDIDHAGSLTLNGPKSTIEIYSDDFFHLTEEQMRCVRGVSKDGVSISAINCVGPGVPGTQTYHGRRKRFMSLVPNFVVLGPRHLEPQQSNIASVSFSFTAANELFYDWGTFGQIIRKHRLSFGQLREILRAVSGAPKRRRRGGHLDLFYRWDRGPIIEIETTMGTLKAWNATSERFPSPSGIELRNRVRVTCDFAVSRTLEGTVDALYEIMPFFELVSQSRQNIENIALTHVEAPERELPLALHLVNLEHTSVENLEPTDALVSGGLQPEEFGRTLTGWINTMARRRTARYRFVQGFRRGHKYEIDRLVGAANAFDLLPSSDFDKSASLPPEVEALLSGFEHEVKARAKSSSQVNNYRDRILNLLGLNRGLNLRNKVFQRYATLSPVLKGKLAGMEEIIGCSVSARNFYVHGTPTKFSAVDLHALSIFFTDTLEFIFATTELQLCGWSAERWAKESYSHSRLKWYISNFPVNKQRVESALSVAASGNV